MLNIPANVQEDIKYATRVLLQKFPQEINKIILFGSYAKENYQPDSDVDLAVVLNTLPEKKERRKYTQALDLDLEREFDLLFCTKAQLDSGKMVYQSINETGVVLYEQLS